jgi:hypothetical protein
MSTFPPADSDTTTTVSSGTIDTALNYANSTISKAVQNQSFVQQARSSQQQRTVTLLTARYGADSTQVKSAQAALNSSKTAIARIAAVKQQVSLAAPQVSANGWALYGHVYNSQLAPAVAFTVFLVDEQKAYQKAYPFAYTGKDGSFVINYPGAENAPAAPALYLEIANAKAQPVYLSTTAFQPQTGVATYQDITLPPGEPVLGDPPTRIREIALPQTDNKADNPQP